MTRLVQLVTAPFRSRCLFTAAVVFGIYIDARGIWAYARPTCTEATTGMAPSPDGAWLAIAKQESCRAYFVTAHVTTTVELSPMHQPSEIVTVLRGTTPQRTAPAPALGWPEGRLLTIAADPALPLLAGSAGDVQVRLQQQGGSPSIGH